MISFYVSLLLPFLAWFFTLAGTYLLLPVLKHFRVVDVPSSRGNHLVPTLRGGGIAMIASCVIFLGIAGIDIRLILGTLVLALISFEDDLKGLSVAVRLLAQFVAVIFALQAIPGRIFPTSIPYFLEASILTCAWIWYINLTNFMDGIDGITAMQTIIMMTGICLTRAVIPTLPQHYALCAIILAASAFGFYAFNRSPARVFMGDVGSIPLGFLTGYLLLSLASFGQWAAALILPAYYISDSGFTLLKRVWGGKKWWQAHSDHAYQTAVRAGFSHTEVVTKIALLNNILVQFAILSTLTDANKVFLVCAAYGMAALILYHFLHATAHR